MKSFGVSPAIHEYAAAHANPSDDAVAARLAAATRAEFGDRAGMNIDVDQGRFLEAMVAISGAQMVVEVGTFTGMSALWMARGLPADGRLICCELVDTYAAIARAAWREASVEDRIELRFGRAADTIAALPAEPHIDLAFIDADKGGYRTYLDLLLPRVRDDGVIFVDNVLWSGQVVDASDTSADTEAIRAFNDHVAQRDDCTAVMLTIGDGLTLIRPQRR